MNFDLRSLQDEFSKHVIKSSHVEYLYVNYLESLYDDLEHFFNTPRPKRFLKSLPDAYSKKACKLFYLHGYVSLSLTTVVKSNFRVSISDARFIVIS